MSDDVAVSLAEVAALVDSIRPLLAGRDPGIVGAALADLMAIYLAGHRPDLRAEILEMHIEVVEKLIPVNEAQMGFPWGSR